MPNETSIEYKNLREESKGESLSRQFVMMRIDGIVNRNHIGRGWVF